MIDDLVELANGSLIVLTHTPDPKGLGGRGERTHLAIRIYNRTGVSLGSAVSGQNFLVSWTRHCCCPEATQRLF
jgi:hypothetical protein